MDKVLVYLPGVVLLITSVVFLTLAISHGKEDKKVRGISSIFAIQALDAISILFEHASSSLEAKFFWDYVQYFCTLALVSSVLIFTLFLINHPQIPKRAHLLLVTVLPLICMLLVFPAGIRPSAHLYVRDYFLYMTYDLDWRDYVMASCAYLYLLLSAVLLWRYQKNQVPLMQAQAEAFILALIPPLAGGVLTLLEIEILGQRDHTPITFSLFNLVLGIGLVRNRFFDILPVARNAVMLHVRDAVLVLNSQNLIVEANPAAEELFGKNIGKNAFNVLPPDLKLKDAEDCPAGPCEIAVCQRDQTRYFEVNSTSFHDSKGRFAGRMLIFHDISARRFIEDSLRQEQSLLEQRVQERTHELTEINARLEEEIEERRTVEEDRTLYSQEMETLYHMAVQLAGLGPGENVHTFISEQLRQISGAVAVTTSSYDPQKKQMGIRHISVNNATLARVNQLLGQNLTEMSFPVSPKMHAEITSGIIGKLSSLNEATFGSVPPAASRLVQKLFNLEGFVGLAFVFKEQLLGTAMLVMGKGQAAPSERLLRSLAHICSIALHREQMEARRVESEERFREMTDMLPIAVYECDIQGQISFANRQAFNIFGYSQQDGDGFLNILDIVSETDRPRVTATMQEILGGANVQEGRFVTLHGESVLGREVTARRKDGSQFPMLTFAAPIRKAGKICGLRGAIIDISALKQSEQELRANEEKFRSIVEQFAEGFLLVDGAGTVVEVNAAFSRLSGLERSRILGMKTWDLQRFYSPPGGMRPERVEQLKRITLEALQNRQSPIFEKPLKLNMLDAAGEEHVVRQTLFPVETPAGRWIGCIVFDITQERQTQQTLERYARRMELLHHIDSAILAAHSTHDIARAALNQMEDMLDLDSACVSLIRGKSQEVLSAAGNPAILEAISASLDSLLERLNAQEMIHIPDVDSSSDLPELCRACQEHGVRSVLLSPLSYQDQLGGMLSLFSKEAGAFSSASIEIAAEVANQMAIAIHQSELDEQTRLALLREQKLNLAAHSLSSTLDLDTSIPAFISLAREMLEAEGVNISLLQEEDGQPVMVDRYVDSPFSSDKAFPEGRGVAWDIFRTRQPILLARYAEHPDADPGLVQAGLKSLLGAPIQVGDKFLGVIGFFRFSNPQPFTPRDVELAGIIANQAGLALRNAHLYGEARESAQELAEAYESTIEGWSRALELRDKETQGHSERVMHLSLLLAQAIGLPEKEIIHFRRGVFLHDIGKMGIPDNILLKPGALTQEEWVIMRQHPEYGRRVLEGIPYLQPALDVPYCHHERWDGTGYPRRLKGEDIPLAARIFSVVDVWDALTSDRPYRPAWGEAAALDYLKENAGTQFDPQVVKAFLELAEKGRLAPEPY